MQECKEDTDSDLEVGRSLSMHDIDQLAIDILQMCIENSPDTPGHTLSVEKNKPYYLHMPTQDFHEVLNMWRSCNQSHCTSCGKAWFLEWSPMEENPSDYFYYEPNTCFRCGHMQTEEEMAADSRKHSKPDYILFDFCMCAKCGACANCWQRSGVLSLDLEAA